jgi:hypothetical protein
MSEKQKQLVKLVSTFIVGLLSGVLGRDLTLECPQAMHTTVEIVKDTAAATEVVDSDAVKPLAK